MKLHTLVSTDQPPTSWTKHPDYTRATYTMRWAVGMGPLDMKLRGYENGVIAMKLRDCGF